MRLLHMEVMLIRCPDRRLLGFEPSDSGEPLTSAIRAINGCDSWTQTRWSPVQVEEEKQELLRRLEAVTGGTGRVY